MPMKIWIENILKKFRIFGLSSALDTRMEIVKQINKLVNISYRHYWSYIFSLFQKALLHFALIKEGNV